ncbi:DUF2975 domain-containing protein [Glycomyces harbinensis]|uniref:DUF2975 domain-containing protein n=1 Tax=Glycomyces harbinensis TaxID=58114 RepID=A0A1G6YJ33_9ACTN|nr:DUF2975 domain-containing protein [Glycomyces harbinensis]SDD90291.1 Protein of unknown function [Glycomyces harbinensis]
MSSFFIAVLRLGVLATLLGGLFGQIVVIPTTAADEVERFPPYEPFAAFYVTTAILGIVCIQVALVAMWMLLNMIDREALFTQRAFLWVDTIIGASVAATLLALGIVGHLLFAGVPEPPGQDMAALGALGGAVLCTGAGAAFAMLVTILRGLLRKAADLQAEMSEVV